MSDVYFINAIINTWHGIAINKRFQPPIRIGFLVVAGSMDEAELLGEKAAASHAPFGPMLENVELMRVMKMKPNELISVRDKLHSNLIWPPYTPTPAKKKTKRKKG